MENRMALMFLCQHSANTAVAELDVPAVTPVVLLLGGTAGASGIVDV